MVGRKTHEQQQRIIQGREKTSNAGKDFKAEAELKRSDALRKAERKGQKLDTAHADAREENDRSIRRGENQESRHHKDAGR
ncbi:hypothetical protein AU381_22930 [Sinorhizobium glycinis]|uniref:Uncharacterized protein n=1 Tax=Sinorhizobium glycinis TaxID=1472378 RepID=A0A178XTC2_9HYPH|nr:hypothetical protein [Sinorhizobium glycinis]OAP38426.1 hypothetical protein AU381_22930 [Sinorhizobium glycinis]